MAKQVAQLVHFARQATTLSLTWSDGKAVEVPFFWLKDHSPQSRDNTSGDKLNHIRDLDFDVTPKNVQRVNGSLVLDWGDCQLDYPLAWLYNETTGTTDGTPQRTLWKTLHPDDHTFLNSDLVANPHTRKDLLESLLCYGFAIVKGVGTQQSASADFVKNILSTWIRSTHWGTFFRVAADDSPTSLAYSNKALDPHTDLPMNDPPPSAQILHCLELGEGAGGFNYLVDGLGCAELLSAASHDVLATTPVLFRWAGKDETSQCPINLQAYHTILNTARNRVRFNARVMSPLSPSTNSPSTIRAFYKAFLEYESLLLNPEHRVRFGLCAGDLVVMDNARVMHAREVVTGRRVLQGCYPELDYAKSACRVRRGVSAVIGVNDTAVDELVMTQGARGMEL